MHGLNVTGPERPRVEGLRQAQRNACTFLEKQIPCTTSFIPTAPYAVVNETQYNGIYHYYGRADTYFHIGQALGNGMIDLLQKQQMDPECTIQPV